jgi:outer membrane protein assembly factor BamB
MVLASALALTLTGVPARAAIRARPDATPVTDGTVYAVARSADRIYVGGNFTRVMPRIGPFAILSPETGQPTGSPPEVSGGEGRVDSVIADGSGGFYIGGSFTHVAGVVCHNAAHILADGTLDPAWDPEPSGTVLALARLGSSVYLGGLFHGPGSINGNVAREYLAAVDATTGQATGWAPNPDNEVNAITAGGSTVYFAGPFEHAGGVARYRAAAADATTGAMAAWDPHPEGGSILTMEASGTSVYVGGSFVGFGGVTSGRLVALDATSGARKWSAPVGGVVWALAVSGSTV